MVTKVMEIDKITQGQCRMRRKQRCVTNTREIILKGYPMKKTKEWTKKGK